MTQLNKDEARQGETGHGVRWMLVAGTIGALVAISVAYAVS